MFLNLTLASRHTSSIMASGILNPTLAYCWKLRHTQYSISHRMMVIGATDRLYCLEADYISV
jgi:hypothetical protein